MIDIETLVAFSEEAESVRFLIKEYDIELIEASITGFSQATAYKSFVVSRIHLDIPNEVFYTLPSRGWSSLSEKAEIFSDFLLAVVRAVLFKREDVKCLFSKYEVRVLIPEKDVIPAAIKLSKSREDFTNEAE